MIISQTPTQLSKGLLDYNKGRSFKIKVKISCKNNWEEENTKCPLVPRIMSIVSKVTIVMIQFTVVGNMGWNTRMFRFIPWWSWIGSILDMVFRCFEFGLSTPLTFLSCLEPRGVGFQWFGTSWCRKLEASMRSEGIKSVSLFTLLFSLTKRQRTRQLPRSTLSKIITS